jgi:HemY protein
MFWFALKLLAVIGGALWLASQPGTVQITWRDQIIETSLAAFELAVFGAVLLLLLVYRLWRFVIDGWQRWKLQRRLTRLERGQGELSWALTALAAGDADEAQRMTHRARKKLGASPLVLMLQAQAARATGDNAAAVRQFRQLVATPEGAIIGMRGLLSIALQHNDWDEVAKLCDEAKRKNIEMPWLSTVAYRLALRQEKWDDAYRALSYALSAGQLPADNGYRQMAALLLTRAEHAEQDGHDQAALDCAMEAYRLNPEWIPGQLAVAELQLKTGHRRAAAKLIEKHLPTAAHPQLAELYRQLHHDDLPLAYFQRLQKLLRDHAADAVTQRLLAAAALEADLWGEARRLLQTMINAQATASDYHQLARLERRERGDEAAAMRWLSHSVRAAPDPQWQCQECGAIASGWQPHCPTCQGFATLAWRASATVPAVAPAAKHLPDDLAGSFLPYGA